jgi:fumarate reductase subunit D
MNVWLRLVMALFRGDELLHVEAWKKGGAAAAVITAILSALVGIAVARGWVPADVVTTESIAVLSSALVSVVGVVLGYLQIATSRRVGLRRRDDDGMLDEHVPPEYRSGESGGGLGGDARGGFRPE